MAENGRFKASNASALSKKKGNTTAPSTAGMTTVDDLQGYLESLALYYSLATIPGLFLAAFVILAAGLLASLPTFM